MLFRSAHPVTEANVHAPARAQEFERTVVALTRLGRFPVDLVERALIDEGEEMILILARAADCSWTTVRELLLMYVAERRLEPEHLTRAFDRYRKLSRETARKVVDFYGRRMKLRAQRNAQAGNAGAQDAPKPASSATASPGTPLVSCVAARAGVRA